MSYSSEGQIPIAGGYLDDSFRVSPRLHSITIDPSGNIGAVCRYNGSLNALTNMPAGNGFDPMSTRGWVRIHTRADLRLAY